MADEIEPVEADYHRDLAEARRTGDPWTPLPVLEELKAKAREQGLWNLFLPRGARRGVRRAVRHRRRRGADQRRLRAARRADGPLGDRAAGLQLQRARHRQHGGAAALRHRGAARRVARAAARRADPLGVHDDRARRGVAPTRPTWRPPRVVDGDEVVVNGRKWWSTGVGHPDCKILVFMGRHRPRRRPAPPALDGARAARHPRREGRAAAARRWGSYDEPLGHGEVSFTDVRVPLAQRHLRARARRSRSPRAGSARAGSTTACG